MSIAISSDCDEQEFIQTVRLNGLLEFNMNKTDGKLMIPNKELLYVARNENNTIIGGIFGVTYLSALEIDVLWVHEDYRGQGVASQLLKTIEEEAGIIGCRLSHLSTYSFQAPPFYQKKGYSVCGTVDGFPDNILLYILRKALI